MRNLKALKKNLIQLRGQTLGFCIDADNGLLYVVKQRLEVIKISTLEPAPKPETLSHDLDLTSEFVNASSNDIRLIEFLVESGSIFVALKDGHLLRIGVSPYSPPSGCLYKHHSGIESVKISPDQDLIAIADDTSCIHIVGLDGELLHKENALSQSDSQHKPVGVGWGSKETQFFGLDGRPSKERQLNEHRSLSEDELITISKIESSDRYKEFRSKLEKNTVIDWRGDGQYLATLTFIPDTRKHYLKVWNRNLELQYMSDQLVTIERDLLTWIPDGHFICCAQRRDGTINEIALFEKNGLVHQRITLPVNLKNLYIKDVVWSPNSKILALVAIQFDLDGDYTHFTTILMMYTMQNFHYYLKFTTKLSKDLYHTIRWNPINHSKLHVMSDDGSYHEYVCNFEVSYSEQYSTVAMIDSNKVLVSPLQISTVPPPMAALILDVKSPIYAIALNDQKSTDMFIFTFDNRLICTNSDLRIRSDGGDDILMVDQIFQPPKVGLDILTECYKSNHSLYRIDNVHTLQNFIPINSAKLIATRVSGSGCEILTITLPGTIDARIETIAQSDQQVVAISRVSEIDYEKVVLVKNDGSTVILDCRDNSLLPLFHFGPNLKMNFIELKCISSHDKIGLISLFQDMNLLFNGDTFLATSCTSFRVTKNYLVYTTTENHLHFLPLDRLWNGSMGDTYSQPIEVGAALITASEIDAKVVLQMPRGNIEILHPRVLVFSTIMRLLNDEEFVQAMKVARRHRVNMNFICDYLLRMYCYSMSKVEHFAHAIASHDPQLLSLFLTELENDDTISGRYDNIMKHLPDSIILAGHKKPPLEFDKIQKVCSAIKLPDNQKFLHPKLLSLLRQVPKKTSEALWLVHKLDKDSHREALEFMLYFIDVDQLIVDALSTYNTDIALMVAGVSHKDPKEYLALLDEFNAEKDNLLRAFKIDMHTKLYGKAFAKLLQYHDSRGQYLDEPETHAQLREIAISKRIFKQALACFKSTTKDLKLFEELWSDYGSYLLEKRCYLEAGLAFSKALELKPEELDHFNKALNCFSLSNSSENAFALIPKLSNMDINLEPIINRLLEENKSLEAIALLTTSKLKASNDAVDVSSDSFKRFTKKLLDKGYWYFVDYIFSQHSGRLVRSVISDHIKDLVQSQISARTEELHTIQQQFDRLKELLKTYKSRAANEQTNMNPNFISDSLSTIDGSEISSVSGSGGRVPAGSGASSIKTRNSTKSNKSQVQRKKRINLKPGSRYEDLALALELRRFILRQKSDADETMRLLAGSFEYCYSTESPEDEWARKESRRLNDLSVEHFNMRQTISSLLWPDSPMNEQMFSLYRRFSNLLSEEGRTYENEEFEVLMRPHLPKEPARFEL